MTLTLEEQGKKIMRVATKKPLTGAQLVEKLNKNLSGDTQYSTRGISRAIGLLVRNAELIKNAGTPATYQKP